MTEMLVNDVKVIRELVREIKKEETAIEKYKADAAIAEQSLKNAIARWATQIDKLRALLSKVGLIVTDESSGGNWETTFREFCIMLERQSMDSSEREMRRGE